MERSSQSSTPTTPRTPSSVFKPWRASILHNSPSSLVSALVSEKLSSRLQQCHRGMCAGQGDSQLLRKSFHCLDIFHMQERTFIQCRELRTRRGCRAIGAIELISSLERLDQENTFTYSPSYQCPTCVLLSDIPQCSLWKAWQTRQLCASRDLPALFAPHSLPSGLTESAWHTRPRLLNPSPS